MGKTVQVKAGVSGVVMPDLKLYLAGQSCTVTDAEYAAFNTATLNSVTVTASGVTDPVRGLPFGTDLSQIAQNLVAVTGQADGQIPAWSASSNKWLPANPVGQSELASVANVSGTVSSCSASGTVGATVLIPNTSISVPASNGRNVVLHFGAGFIQTAAGQGSVYLSIRETTGTPTVLQSAIMNLPNSTAGALSSLSLTNQYPIGPVASTRTFSLQVLLYAVAANTPAGNVLNSSLAPSFLRAVAG